jgi:hypothetical protein
VIPAPTERLALPRDDAGAFSALGGENVGCRALKATPMRRWFKELQSLCLDVEVLSSDGVAFELRETMRRRSAPRRNWP